MCRMIAFVGKDDSALESLYSVFRHGSQCDPLATAAFPSKPTCHPNGWGYALYDGVNLHHYRSSRPVWEEAVSLPRLKGRGVFAVLHSRLASDPTLDAPGCSHPFVASTPNGILLLAHNGGVQTDPSSPKDMVDSEWALGVIAAQGIESALPLLKHRTKPNSALNLIVLSIPRDPAKPPELHCLNFFNATAQNRVDYYRMYRAELGSGQVFFSSTFKEAGIKGLANVETAPFGELFSLRLPEGMWSSGEPRHSLQSVET